MSAIGHQSRICCTQKSPYCPVEGDNELQKQTNEIGMVIPLLDAIVILGKTLTVSALLTQRKFAEYLVNREADYHFTVKNNQPTLREDIALFFKNRQEPDFIDYTPPNHGRIEIYRGLKPLPVALVKVILYNQISRKYPS